MSEKATSDAVIALDTLSRIELGERFADLFGRAAPKGMSRPLLLHIVAYRIQEDAGGGPNRDLRQRLARLAKELQNNGTVSTAPKPEIKPGTRLLREWRGTTHTVTATEAGFEYQEKTYNSLSMIAREITGTRWSGPAFFGLKGRNTGSEGQHGR
jgi:hypothetical protein